MKIKKSLIRSTVIISLIALSILIGFAYDTVCSGIDRKNYPCDYAEYVRKYSEEYGVPEQVIYGVIKSESNFSIAHDDGNGRVGLMGLDTESFDFVARQLKQSLDYDSRYGPETNIKYGTYLLSYLYTTFGDWDAVYAAKSVSLETWQSWACDSVLFGDDGKLREIPDVSAESASKKTAKYVQKYREMYYE